MTVQEVKSLKMLAEQEIFKIIDQLVRETKCECVGISLTTEEGFGYDEAVLTNVHIKLQIK